ncbi:MAG: hypothetical protein ACHQQQ_03045 [Bacteroidota bacterium]
MIQEYTSKDEIIIDPFSGSGVIPLEAILHNRFIIASDINPYGNILTLGKLYPPNNYIDAIDTLLEVEEEVKTLQKKISLSDIPKWVRTFFHPKTLIETLAYSNILKKHEHNFQLACLLGILHHQRIGFLSYPSSHSTPYLRNKNFPKEKFPELYTHRSVFVRLTRKIIRTLRETPSNKNKYIDKILLKDIRELSLKKESVDACITSPPYMNNLSYGRDNRLRLWILGYNDWKIFDDPSFNRRSNFKELIEIFFQKMHKLLKHKGLCILIVGEARSQSLDSIILESAITGNFKLIDSVRNTIPSTRRTRRENRGTIQETTFVFQKRGY